MIDRIFCFFFGHRYLPMTFTITGNGDRWIYELNWNGPIQCICCGKGKDGIESMQNPNSK